MFSLTSSQRYWLCGSATDMRKNFDGLCGLVSNRLGRDVQSGEVFIFINKRRDKIKLLPPSRASISEAVLVSIWIPRILR